MDINWAQVIPALAAGLALGYPLGRAVESSFIHRQIALAMKDLKQEWDEHIEILSRLGRELDEKKQAYEKAIREGGENDKIK